MCWGGVAEFWPHCEIAHKKAIGETFLRVGNHVALRESFAQNDSLRFTALIPCLPGVSDSGEAFIEGVGLLGNPGFPILAQEAVLISF